MTETPHPRKLSARTGTLTRVPLLFAVLLLLLPAACLPATIITITDTVLVPDTLRLGTNMVNDSYWDSPVKKMRVAANFEGTLYRACTHGPEQDSKGIAAWFGTSEGMKQAMAGKAKFTILNGPAKGQTGIIADITKKKIKDGREIPYYVFDHEVPSGLNIPDVGIMLELDRRDDGTMHNDTKFWNTTQNEIRIGDVPPGSFGKAALLLRGTEQPTHYAFVPMFHSIGNNNGLWHARFWAKAGAGQPVLTVELPRLQKQTVNPEGAWKQYDLTFTVENLPDTAMNGADFLFRVTGGDLLLDDVEIWMAEPTNNPTAFRDDAVNVLKRLRPGVLRILQMGEGGTLENCLRPALQQFSATHNLYGTPGPRNNVGRPPFVMHDYFTLCEYIGASPWYCTPGSLKPEEIDQLLEYLAAPPTVGFGKLRAEMGHPQPWTEVFEHIYVEFGNEIWNPGGYATCGYNGPDYWYDLIARGKQSKYFDTSIVFVAGSQAANPWLSDQIARNVKNADRLGVAPYLIGGISKEEEALLDSDDKLFKFVFGITYGEMTKGTMKRQHEVSKKTGIELACYEGINYHTTLPQAKDGGASVELRNQYITGIGGAVNLMNNALTMLKEMGVRTQGCFNLCQSQFYEGIKLWGYVPGLRWREQRYRPAFLGEEIVNKIIGGDLVETTHTGETPTFDVPVYFERPGSKTPKPGTLAGVPTLYSYAFRNGTKRGLVLISLDTATPREVEVRFAGLAKDGTAQSWWLTADKITANNEYGHPVEVTTLEKKLDNFASGMKLTIPPYSLVGVQWDVK